MALLMVFSRLAFDLSHEEHALMGMGAGFSNTVLLGLPLIVLTFGDAALGPITTMIAFNTLILLPTTIILIEIARGRRDQKSLVKIVLAPLTAMIRNPILIAIVTGAAWSFIGFGLAVPLERFIDLPSGAAGPCALFVLGTSLAEYRDWRDGRRDRVRDRRKTDRSPGAGMVIVHRNLRAGRADDQCCDDDGGDPGRRNGVYRGPAVPGIRWSGHIRS